MHTNIRSQLQARPAPTGALSRASLLQRKCACGGTPGADGQCATCRARRIGVQRRAIGPAAPRPVPQVVRDVLRSPGQPLDGTTRSLMESRLAIDAPPAQPGARIDASPGDLRVGSADDPAEREAEQAARMVAREPARSESPARAGHDFSKVRVHTDARAAQAARSVGALAFTVGQHIVFADGQYAPGLGAGRRLLAHELAHVGQSQARPGAATIRRYESFEHRDLGDRLLHDLYGFLQTEEGRTWARAANLDVGDLVAGLQQDPARQGQRIKVRPDLELTPGEIIALMGDLYGTWQALASAPAGEIRRLLAVMDQEQRAGRSSAAANTQYEQITQGRFTQLARGNITHFAPRNREQWQHMHEEAITRAQQAGRANDEAGFQQALLIDAAGGHFLTDVFAAGHLFNVTEVLYSIQRYLREHPIRTENPEMQTIVGLTDVAGLAPQLALKNIHDRMNQDGFSVTNRRGMHWRTFGDNSLRNAQETQRIAALAVFLSRRQVTRARAGATPDPAEVLDLLPDENSIRQATDQALAYIPTAVRDISQLIYSQRSILGTLRPPWYLGGPVLPAVGQSLITTIGDPGRARQLEDLERRSTQRREGPLLAPSFTIATF